jgi:phosphonate transport system permease protein
MTTTTFDATWAELRRGSLARLAQTLLVLGIVGACLAHAGLFDAERLAEGGPALLSLLGEMTPPDFGNLAAWGKPLLDTLAMSVAGTALAVALSLPLGFLAAANATPHPLVHRLARGLLNMLRSVPELVMGIVFVAAVGFGALPGVLALGLHSVGMVGKFFAEAVEHCDPKAVEAVRASGASRMQVILHAMLPQVLPQMADIVVYRWEYNFRASTVMGMVGAGGIGFELMASLRVMQYQEVSAILLVILVMVTAVDALGSLLRRRFA